jgi:hypothetical protein
MMIWSRIQSNGSVIGRIAVAGHHLPTLHRPNLMAAVFCRRRTGCSTQTAGGRKARPWAEALNLHQTGVNLMGQRIKTLVWVGVLAWLANTSAQAQTLAEKEKQWQSCEAAHYTGPREGRRNYTLDNYLWVVTPEFAQTYCMPESMVSTELKGAQAIAFRMADGADMERCGVDDQGKHHCTRQSTGRFEIYLPQSLKLPAANPDVRFYENRRNTSEWLFSGNQDRVSRSQRYIKGQYTPPPGTVPRFRNIFGHPDHGHGFGLWFMPKGQLPWPTSSLWEVGFRESVAPGVDMVILENTLGMDFGFELKHYKASKIEPGDPSGRYVIVMHKRDAETASKKDKRVPQDFDHVIYLPHAFAMQVRDTAMKSGAR